MTTPASRVGLVGLGAMGEPMARHLHAAGLLAAVWNRSRDKSGRFAANTGVALPQTLAELAAACDVVVTCVSADRDVLDVVDALCAGLQPGSLVIDTSTVAPATARSAAQRLAAIGADFIDAPLTGGVEGARNGTLSVLVGGTADAFERARPVLATFGRRVVRFGDVGAGQATKAVNQVMVAGIAEAVCEGLALAERLGLDTDALIDTLGNGAAGTWFMDKRGRTMLAGKFDVGFKLRLLHKDLGIVAALAEEAGMTLPTATAAQADYAHLLEAGYGDEDISSLIRLKLA
ncbi:NAD(P)-dependent oxidoreductase [Pseudofulvimonas gallinarii]|uniref:3-hydroxyisobutyrate dehydrogenase n=1 Tax=Pseudofulvimonas gallinarii TaxID=634155 RepID=A0A4R3LIB4_9GAMM|nr:NAD(P)-dependent oxidoreductase [Pseudofulvimonas gallinarii]TCS98214.1 3-hydroxyisobutyrate dehydrogenase [Pseudofulvimonas gallinarii]THD13810.1 oxidoreductase [Pseudofulvimonas gallinarii]